FLSRSDARGRRRRARPRSQARRGFPGEPDAGSRRASARDDLVDAQRPQAGEPARSAVARRQRGRARRKARAPNPAQSRGEGHLDAPRRRQSGDRMTQCLTIRDVRSVAVEVPMAIALGTSAQKIDRATLLLIDLDTHEGVTGRSYVFCVLKAAAAPVAHMLQEALRIVKGEKVAPHEIRMKLLRHFRLIGVQGIVRMAIAGLDVACWDALAIAAGLPLVRMLGGVP